MIEKAVALMQYTYTITSNRKRYPVKYIQLIKRIQNMSMDIYELLLDANRTDVNSFKAERMNLQTKAISACDKLSCYAELSMNLKLIGSDTAMRWQKLIGDIKHMTISWRNKDKAR